MQGCPVALPTEATQPKYKLSFDMVVMPFGLSFPLSANLRFCFVIFRV